MCFDASQGNTTTPGQATAQTLAAQIKYAPQTYGMNATYSPLYTSLNLSNLNTFLNGSKGNPGYLSLYENQIAPAAARATVTSNNAIRTGNLNDIEQLLPQMTTITRQQNPQAAGLLDQLSSTASHELAYGTQLTLAEQLQLNQSVRAGQASRGMGFGPSDVFNESVADTNMGQQLLAQREQAASNVAGQTEGFYGNNIATILGQNANMGTAGTLSGTGSGSVANYNMMDPTSMSNNYMALATSTSNQNAAQQNQMTESAMNGMQRMGSSMMGGM